MNKFEELNTRNSTIIEWMGKELRTVQDPYPSDCGKFFVANAVDENNFLYHIQWSTIDMELELDEICNWDQPYIVGKTGIQL